MSSSYPSARFGARTVDRASAWLARSDLMTAASIERSGRAAASPVVRSAGRPVRRLAARSVPSHRTVPGWALASAGLSPVVLVGAWLVADALQPGSYSPVRQTVSALAGHAATHRWIMSGAMCLVAACYLLTALGLAGLRTSARVVLAVAGPEHPRLGHRDRHLRGPARMGPHRTHQGSVLGLAERMTTAVQMSWPFVVALALRATSRNGSASPGQLTSSETHSPR